MCKIYLVSSIANLFIVIVSNICNKQNSIILNVMINILLFLNVYYNLLKVYFVLFYFCQHQLYISLVLL
jgi:hypothetical protein